MHPRDAWDTEYVRRGRRWAGDTRMLPAFPSHQRILETGCGDGKTLRALAAARQHSGGESDGGPEIVGLDFSRAALRVCSREMDLGSRVHLVCADAAAIPFISSAFDAVILVHVLGHATRKARVRICREVERVVRPGGRVFIRVFSTGDFRAGRGEEIEEMTFLRGDGTFTHYFMMQEICDLFPAFSPESQDHVSWSLRVRGKNLVRDEIHAVLIAPES